MNGHRTFGVLLHPTCLPSGFGIGDLGPGALAWLDWLGAAGASWWQILPLNPTGGGNSPYSAPSTFAGNPLLISPELLRTDGLLTDGDLADVPALPEHRVDYAAVAPVKERLLRRAFARFEEAPPAAVARDLSELRRAHARWLEDYAVFTALKSAHGGTAWSDWAEPLARHETGAVAEWRRRHDAEVRFVEFCQLVFLRQWRGLHERAAELGVSILGDVPIFVALDSAEVWASRDLFRLDDSGRPTHVAGVPPDYFSATGQLWGNPLYDWERMAGDGFAWWRARLRHTLGLVDAVRLDHFRGFAAYWEVPAGDETAVGGRWIPGPGRPLFDAVAAELGGLPFVAEDLGEITDDVHELRRELGLPGMAVLHFGFSTAPRSTFIPYAHERDQVVYTGTHDNNTTLGWFMDDATPEEKGLFLDYSGSDGTEVHWDMIRLALGSVSDLAVIPHQDVVGLGGDCRMNRPATAAGNWEFRVTPWMLEAGPRDRLAAAAEVFGRRRQTPRGR